MIVRDSSSISKVMYIFPMCTLMYLPQINLLTFMPIDDQCELPFDLVLCDVAVPDNFQNKWHWIT